MGYMAMCRGFHSGQTTGHSREHARGLCTSGHFPSSSHKISTVNLRHSSHLGTKLNHSAPPNVLFLSFTGQATAFLIRKSSPRETNDNYRDKNTSRHVSLRTRRLDKKIHYCCRDSFFVEKDIQRVAPFRAVFKVKTLAVLFSPYPREVKHIPRNLNLPPFWRLLVSIEMVQSIPTLALSRARGLSMRTHLTAVEPRVGLGFQCS